VKQTYTFVDMLHLWNIRTLLLICYTSGSGVIICRYDTLVEQSTLLLIYDPSWACLVSYRYVH